MTDFINSIECIITQAKSLNIQTNEIVDQIKNLISQYENCPKHSESQEYINLQAKKLHEELIAYLNLISNNILVQLKSIKDAEFLTQLKKYDTSIYLSSTGLIHNACIKNDTQLVIWLIEKGFSYYSQDDTLEIATHGNFELFMKYKELGDKFNPFVPRKLIEYNHFYLFKWMFDNDLVDKTHCDYAKNYLMLYAIGSNRVKFLEYMAKEQHMVISFSDFKKPTTVYEYDLNSQFRNNKVLNETLEWLWTNGYKWTETDAKKFNNKYMTNKYNLDKLNNQIYIMKQMNKILVYVVKYKDFHECEFEYYFVDQKKAYKFAYFKAYLNFLRKQLKSNGDFDHEINDDEYLQEYIDNHENITIVSKNWFQSKDEGFGDIYSSFDIIDNNTPQNSCINYLRKQKKLIICFGMPEKYIVINNCVNNCCHTIKWFHKYEYNFKSFILYEEFDGSYIDMDNSVYIILVNKYVNSDTNIEFYTEEI